MHSDEAIAVVTETLERCAERDGDIVPAVYERFFALSEDARRLMAHSDPYMRGRMFEEVLALLMSDAHFGAGRYLDWELDNHLNAYQVTAPMYEALFRAVTEVVQTSLGPEWTEPAARAWQQRTARILGEIAALAANPAAAGTPSATAET